MPETLALVRLDALRHNISILRQLAGATQHFLVAVKANAYGHGSSQLAPRLIAAGVSHLGVARAQELHELAAAGLASRTLLMANATSVPRGTLGSTGAECFVADMEAIRSLEAEAASSAHRPLRVHIKVDTGMRRLGCEPEQAAELARAIQGSEHLELAGVASHLAVADSLNAVDRAFTSRQIRSFEGATSAIRAAGIDPRIVHLRNSAAICTGIPALGPTDMPRPGISVYGYQASAELEAAYATSIPLRPVMSLITRLVRIRRIEAGQGVSYGLHYRPSGPRWIGTLPVGYGDGLPRAASGKLGFVHLETGAELPQVGTICMDLCMVDLGPAATSPATGTPAAAASPAAGTPAAAAPPFSLYSPIGIFGEGFPETAASIASKAGSIPYEITSGISSRVPRYYPEDALSLAEIAALFD